MIRVLIADDQVLLAQALATVLGSQDDIEIAAVCQDGAAAVAAVDAGGVDVAVLDVRMPGTDGLAALERIRARDQSRPRVLMLTTFNVAENVEYALAHGADGFLLKDAEPEELIAAVRTVAGGWTALSAGVTGHLVAALRRDTAAGPAGPAALSPQQRQGLSLLTVRETEVLRLVAAGATNPEIAQRLVVAPATVKTHVSNLLAKLHCRDRVALVILARDAGIDPPKPR